MENDRKYEKSVMPQFLEAAPETGTEGDEHGTELFEIIDDIAAMTMEAAFVIDFQKRCFCFVANHDLFLCGHTPEEVMKSGYDFLVEAVHPDDRQLLKNMYNAVSDRLRSADDLKDVNYFSCTFRIRCNFIKGVHNKNPDYVMVYLKLKPLTMYGQMNRFGLCLLASSVITEPGNLGTYYKNSLDFDAYSFVSGKWERQKGKPLSDRQRFMILYTKQGKKDKEIADMLCITVKAYNAEKTRLFENLGVTTMRQATVYATNHQQIFVSSRKIPDIPKEPEPDKKPKQRHELTPDVLKRIQTGLDNGLSIRSLARREGFSEKAIRKAIGQGKLTKGAD
jgi:DNA-binding CsgD family transcriptional regulator